MHYFRSKNDPAGLVIETDSPEHWRGRDWEEIKPKAEGKRAHVAYAKAQLQKLIQPGDRLYTVLRHVSGSGMSRRIDVYKLGLDDKGAPRPVYLSGYASTVLGWKLDDSNGKRGITVGGCGMDMGFHLVYSLASAVLGDGYAVTHEWL